MQHIILYSGGLDSTVLLYDILHHKTEFEQICLYFFNYNQKNYKQELKAVKYFSNLLNIPYTELNIVDIFNNSTANIINNFNTNIHTDEVIGRNLIFVINAFIHLVQDTNIDLSTIYLGINKNVLNYIDCSQEMIDALNNLLKLINNNVILKAPFLTKTKAQILNLGQQLNVPIEKTWSCYEDGKEPCGKCGACLDRKALGIF